MDTQNPFVVRPTTHVDTVEMLKKRALINSAHKCSEFSVNKTRVASQYLKLAGPEETQL